MIFKVCYCWILNCTKISIVFSTHNHWRQLWYLCHCANCRAMKVSVEYQHFQQRPHDPIESVNTEIPHQDILMFCWNWDLILVSYWTASFTLVWESTNWSHLNITDAQIIVLLNFSPTWPPSQLKWLHQVIIIIPLNTHVS